MSYMQYEARYTLAPGGTNPVINAGMMNAPADAPARDDGQDRRAGRPLCRSVSFPACGAAVLDGLAAQGRQVGRVGIVGASNFGIGIALRLLEAGIPVTLFELDRAALNEGIALVRAGLDPASDKGDECMALLAASVNFHHLKDCDLIVDAAPCDMAGKQKLFRRLDQVAKPGAVLATQAPRAGIEHIARYTRRAGEVLGLQVENVSMTGETWQIVSGKDTAGASLGTLVALAWQLGQKAEVCDACHGAGIDMDASWNIDRAQD